MKGMIEQFEAYLIDNRWYSSNTVSNYLRTLDKFNEYLLSVSLWSHGVEECEKITLHNVGSYIRWQRENWLSVRTCNNQLAAIRKYLRFCMQQWLCVIDYKSIENWKEYKKKIWYLSEEEQEKLIYVAQHDMKTPEVVRMRNLAMVYLFLYTWMRVSELCNLKVEDIAEEMQIEWKWWSLRPTYLFNKHIQVINLYWFLRKWKHIESDYVFCSHSRNYPSRKMSRNAVEKIIKTLWEKAWIELFPHKLRHTFATNLLKQGTNLYHIQKLLGHANINTTIWYLWATNYELENEVKKLHLI